MSLENDARQFAERILKIAEETNVDSDVFVMAMADTIGAVAAMLDRERPQDIEDRLKTLNDRIRERYKRMVAAQLVMTPGQSILQYINR